MSKAYQFPHDEPNPFAESAASPAETGGGDNPYATQAIPAQSVAAGPDTFHATLAPRDGRLILLSVMGLGMALAAVPLVMCYLPLALLSLPLSLCAWGMARHDLRAMAHGAMRDEARGRVRFAQGVALIGSVLGLLTLAAVVLLLVRALNG
jgi:hypothetical protein